LGNLEAMIPQSIDDLIQRLESRDYFADRPLATVLYLALAMEKPLFLEGEAGVGKTEVAKVLADVLGGRLIRLQCHEGIDAASALYEWNYPKQLLKLKSMEVLGGSCDLPDIFTEEYLIRRPLLAALDGREADGPVVLLIDELDRADEEFEAFLLEILSDFTVSIPEIGTLRARRRPVVVLTSNRTRDVGDALKRRCLYHWIDYPSLEKEYQIVARKTPGLSESLGKAVCAFMAKVREMDYLKKPGVAETLDWARALILLGREVLDPQAAAETLGCIFKYEEDLRQAREAASGLVKGLCGPAG
jgi:MoxR-like ATPase